MVAANRLQFVLQLLEFDRIAHRHRNHRLVTAGDLEIARKIARRNGLVFPSNNFISILELVDGRTSEQKVQQILETLRAFDRYDYLTPERDFPSDESTVVDSEERDRDRPPVPPVEEQPRVPWKNGYAAPPTTPATTTTTEASFPPPPSWISRWKPTIVAIIFAFAVFGTLQYLVGSALPNIPLISRPSPPPPKDDPPADYPSYYFLEPPEAARGSQLSLEYVSLVVAALKQATSVSSPGRLRRFHRHYPYFVTGTSGADVVQCLQGGSHAFFRDSNQEDRRCARNLRIEIEPAVQLMASAPGVPSFNEEWMWIASCLAWTTCAKVREWDITPSEEDIWDKRDDWMFYKG